MALGSGTRILVMGGTGMLGHMLVSTLSSRYDVWCTVRKPWHDLRELDLFYQSKILTDVSAEAFPTVVKAIDECYPDVVINCIGLVKQSSAATDPVRTIAINSLFPHRLAEQCKGRNIKLIHISTDCVFDGTRGNYTENDHCDAEDLYGRSKALGEPSGEHCLTLRTSIVGPELYAGHGLFDWFVRSQGSVKGYTNAVFSGLTTLELSNVIGRVLDDHPELSGLYHIASDPIDKYSLLTIVRDALSLDTEITPSDELDIDRSLDGNRFRFATGYKSPSWEQMVLDVAPCLIGSLRNRQNELAA